MERNQKSIVIREIHIRFIKFFLKLIDVKNYGYYYIILVIDRAFLG